MRVSLERVLSLKSSLDTLWRAVRLYVLNRSFPALIQALSFFWRKASGQAPPITACLAVTYRCPCQCPQCYSSVEGRTIRRELSTQECLRALDQLKAIGTLQVIFSGGEPLLRQDIFDLVAHAHRIGLLTRMSTNGHLLTRACAAKLKRAGLNQCGISIDDVDPDVNDRLRCMPGTFARALQGFGYLREFHIDRRMLVYASHANVAAGLERFIELGRTLKVNSYSFNIPFIIGRLAGTSQEMLSEKEMASLRRLQKYSSVSIEFLTPETNCCSYDKKILSINPLGEVNPCPAVPFTLGNVNDEPLAAIWRRHVSALRLESRGRCPLNDPGDRERLRAHCASVATRGRS